MIICQVCYDKGGGKKSLGARFGPEEIERVFKKTPWRCAEDGTPHPGLQWIRMGTSLTHYREKAEHLFAKALLPFIVLSGDNSCSFETVRIASKHFQHVALAVFDAHPDACDSRHDPHAQWVRKLWDEGIVAPQQSIFFGIHDAELSEAQYLKEKKATVISPDGVSAFCAMNIYGNCVAQYARMWQPVSSYALVIVVDIDVLDPIYAPGTGVLCAGGLHVRHVLRFIRDLCALPFAIRIGEICEVIPTKGNAIRPFYDKRPDPCGLTLLAADAIFRQMIRSMAV